jgi:hypothetical protein
MTTVHPRCKAGRTQPYLDAEGFYFPCCWVANHPYIREIKHFLGDKFEQLDANKYTLEEIASSEGMKQLEDSWEEGTVKGCVYFCGKPMKPKETNVRHNGTVWWRLDDEKPEVCEEWEWQKKKKAPPPAE